MKINYKLELDDFFVFSNYLMAKSPLMLKAIRKGQMWWASGPLVGGLILSVFKGYTPDQALLALAVMSVAISLPMFFMYKHYYRYCNKKQINRLYANGNYKEVLGIHEMTIGSECLVEKTEYNATEIPWNAITNIATTVDHTFVFTGDVTAYIIPHKKIVDGNAAQFLAKLNDVHLAQHVNI